jgi:thioredoxin 1
MHKRKLILVLVFVIVVGILYKVGVAESPNYIQVESVSQFETLSKDPKIVICFSAEWCGPCGPVKNSLKSIAKQEKGIKFLIVDIDKLPSIPEIYKVKLIPHVQVKKRFLQGSQPQEKIHNFILKELQ